MHTHTIVNVSTLQYLPHGYRVYHSGFNIILSDVVYADCPTIPIWVGFSRLTVHFPHRDLPSSRIIQIPLSSQPKQLSAATLVYAFITLVKEHACWKKLLHPLTWNVRIDACACAYDTKSARERLDDQLIAICAVEPLHILPSIYYILR